MMRWGLALLVGLSLSVASSAGAVSIGGGTVTPAHSWSLVGIPASAPGSPWDTMEVFIAPGSDTGAGPFLGDGAVNFLPASWSGSQINPAYALSSGPATESLTFDLAFAGDPANSLQIDLLFWNGGVNGAFQWGASLDMTAGIVSVRGVAAGPLPLAFLASPDGTGYDRLPPGGAPIPEPRSAVLFGLGALVTGMAVRGKIARGRGCSAACVAQEVLR